MRVLESWAESPNGRRWDESYIVQHGDVWVVLNFQFSAPLFRVRLKIEPEFINTGHGLSSWQAPISGSAQLLETRAQQTRTPVGIGVEAT